MNALLTALISPLISIVAAAEPPYPLSTPLGGPVSPYTVLILKKLEAWVKAPDGKAPPEEKRLLKQALVSPDAISIECIDTPGRDTYMGMAQAMLVNEKVSVVQAILDDFAHYKDLFPNFDDIHVISTDRNRTLTYWEQHIPLFFVPNVKYKMDYIADFSAPARRVYRYQLHEAGSLKLDDGFIVLERGVSEGKEVTHYFEYDFWDADYGIYKSMGVDRIWKDSLEGIYLSDVAIKIKAEHPERSYEQVRKESKDAYKKLPVDKMIKQRRAGWVSPNL